MMNCFCAYLLETFICLSILISARADNNVNEQFFKALMNNDMQTALRLLDDPRINPNSRNEFGWTPLLYAVGNFDADKVVQKLIDKGANVDDLNSEGSYTPLIAVITNSHLSPKEIKNIVEILIQAGTQVNVQNKEGKTALIWAVNQGYPEIVETLLNNRADPLLTDKKGHNAIYELRSLERVPKIKQKIIELLIAALEKQKQ